MYDCYTACEDDPVIRECIEEAKRDFHGDPESVQVKIHMEIQ
jgi:hypothetical protein